MGGGVGWDEEEPRGNSASVPYRGLKVMTEELTFFNLWLERRSGCEMCVCDDMGGYTPTLPGLRSYGVPSRVG